MAAIPEGSHPTAARIIYIVLFALTSLFAWAMGEYAGDILTWVPSFKLCGKDNSACMGANAVYRVTFALSIFHFLSAAFTIGVKSSDDSRAEFQNNFWPLKILALILLVVVSFLIPNGFFHGWGYVAMIGAGAFILFQLLLFVDFAHSWSMSWCGKMESDGEGGEGDRFWFWALLTCTVLMFLGALAASILMYVEFSHCGSNVIFVTINLLGILVYTFLSVHPKLQEANNYRSGLLQASVVALFSTYMVFSAIMSEPVTWKGCNPWTAQTSNSTSIIIGAIFTIVAVCYSAFNASRSVSVGDTEETVSLVKSEDGKTAEKDGAPAAGAVAITYSYSFFHLAFATGALYVCMLLTSWKIVDSTNAGNVVDSGKVSVWIKLVSSWLTILLYIWTIVAPAILPDRDWS